MLVNTCTSPILPNPFTTCKATKQEGSPFGLVPNLGCQINAHIKSVNTLASVEAYGAFSEELYLLLNDPDYRQLIKEALLQTYFPNTRQNLKGMQKYEGYIHQLEDYILNEPPSPIQKN